MPDFMDSRVLVTGPALDLGTFHQSHFAYRQQSDSVEFQLGSIVPVPEEFRDVEVVPALTLALIALGADLEPTYDPLSAKFDDLRKFGWLKNTAIRSREELLAYLNETDREAVSAARERMEVFKQTGYYDGYAWRLEQWGVKWDATSTIIVAQKPNLLEFEFQTPWCFPEPVFRELGLIYPSLCFDITAVNPVLGMGLRGRIFGADVSLKQMRMPHTYDGNGETCRIEQIHEVETPSQYPCMLPGRLLF